MAEKQLTFEEVDRHFQGVDLAAFQPNGSRHFTAATVAANPADVLSKICSIYQVVRPFLVLLGGIALIPQKWKDALKTFVSLMDSVCPH